MKDFLNTYKQTFFKFLDEKLKDLSIEFENDPADEIGKMSDKIFDENRGLLIDHQASFHLFVTSLILASYLFLKTRIKDEDKIIEILKYAFTEPGREMNVSGITEMLRESDDPFAEFVKIAKDKEDRTYGETFVFEHEEDNKDIFLQNVTRCFYHDFFRAQGVPQLTNVLCSYDFIWMDIFKDGDFGFVVKRPTTLGEGGDKCRFQFLKV